MKTSILPHNRQDQVLFAVFMVGIPFAVFWLGCVVMPHYHTSIDATVIMHCISTLFIVYNIFGNILKVIRIDASGRSSLLPSILMAGWRYCSVCQVNSPPRSYHCFTCNECILKRDHHCKFSGCCVGYHNHRYFLIGISYIWLGALYGICYQWEFIYSSLNLPFYFFFPTLIAPHFAWLLQAIDLWGFILAALHTFALTTLFLVTYLLARQLLAIHNGQTLYERKHNIREYSLTPYENFVDVLGCRWMLVWVSPHINSPLKGDGIKFQKATEFEVPKTL